MSKPEDVTNEVLAELSPEAEKAIAELRSYFSLRAEANDKLIAMRKARKKITARLLLVPDNEQEAVLAEAKKVLAEYEIEWPEDDKDKLTPMGSFPTPFGRVELFTLGD